MSEENKQIAGAVQENPWETKYEFNAGSSQVSVTAKDVFNMIASGYVKPSIGECTIFLHMCKDMGLNPFLKDAYLMKYSASEPATIVVGKNAFMKRAESHQMYKGFQAGLIVEDKDGKVEYKEGAFISKDLTVLGAWCKVYRDDRTHPFLIEVDVEEYVGKKKDGTRNQQWATKEKTMIRKVAIVQCLREAFPQELNALYVEEEFQKRVIDTPVEVTKEELTPEHPRWIEAIEACKKAQSIDLITKHYFVSEDNMCLLEEVLDELP